MKRDDLIKLRTKSIAELQKEVEKLEKELVDLRMQKAIGKNKNTREYKLKRHDLARLKTVLEEKQLAVSV